MLSHLHWHRGKDISKNAYRADRRVELVAASSVASVAEVIDILQGEWLEAKVATEELSYAFGVLIGRWAPEPVDAASATRSSFDAVPVMPPAGRGLAAASTSVGIIVDDDGSDHDVLGVLRVLESLNVDVDDR